MGEFSSLGKMLIFIGVIIAGMGLLMLAMGKLGHIGRLPGDIIIRKGNFTFFFPVVTSIVLSIILTLVVNLLLRR